MRLLPILSEALAESNQIIKVFAGKVRKTGFSQKAGFPGSPTENFGIPMLQSHIIP
jgi:hypothetical protein